MAGGGSGGHITPVLAVAHELKKQSPETKLVYIGQKGDTMVDHVAGEAGFDVIHTVRAGKFRRYNGESVLRHLLDIPTLLKNVRDAFFVLIGAIQSYIVLGKLKPQAVFLKGGYVGVPVGLAAAARHIPIITHDSDALPGLANRLVSRWVSMHATGMPAEFYQYPATKLHYTGVPVGANYTPVSDVQKNVFRQALALQPADFVVLVTGGGLGAQRINKALQNSLEALVAAIPNIQLLLVVGEKNETAEKVYYEGLDSGLKSHVRVAGFVKDMYKLSGAADVVITRAGATAMAELAIQRKACIVVPNPVLTGGHQLKNAQELSRSGAVRVITEDELQGKPETLVAVLSELASQPEARLVLGEKLSVLAKPEATKELSQLILGVAHGVAKA